MNRLILKALVIIITTSAMLTVGCGQPESLSEKKCRVIAAENKELKKELEKSNKEVEMLKAQYGGKIEEQGEQLKKCLREKEELKEKSRQNVRDQVSSVLNIVMEENKNLREENSRLKAQIEELKK
ncbi:MAG: hypothetical protein JXA81_12900 [Sedimentisphaerales bacterium]|nr:hypothetical protein [Sedimentisphaerales bacterium]